MRTGQIKSHLTSHRARYGYLFVAPFVIGFCCFTIWPMLQSLVFSFRDINFTASGYATTFVRDSHYRRLLVVDPTFRLQLLSSLKDMALKVPLIVFFSFFSANLLNSKFKGRTLARAIFFLPVITASSQVLGLDVQSVLAAASGGSGITGEASASTLSGGMQQLFYSMNLPTAWMKFIVSGVDEISVVVAASGVQILLFLSSLQTVTTSQMEAARVEGANAWEIFWKITVPLVSPMILVSTVYTMIDSFTSDRNQVIAAISTQYEKLQLGPGSAMAWMYLLVVFAVIALAYGLLSRAVFYEDDKRR